jgi:hypothetical protein
MESHIINIDIDKIDITSGIVSVESHLSIVELFVWEGAKMHGEAMVLRIFTLTVVDLGHKKLNFM